MRSWTARSAHQKPEPFTYPTSLSACGFAIKDRELPSPINTTHRSPVQHHTAMPVQHKYFLESDSYDAHPLKALRPATAPAFTVKTTTRFQSVMSKHQGHKPREEHELPHNFAQQFPVPPQLTSPRQRSDSHSYSDTGAGLLSSSQANAVTRLERALHPNSGTNRTQSARGQQSISAYHGVVSRSKLIGGSPPSPTSRSFRTHKENTWPCRDPPSPVLVNLGVFGCRPPSIR